MPLASGFMFLAATMDWWSRYVVGWELSNSRDSELCIRAWEKGLSGGRTPLIANSDQGSEYTSEAYLDAVESAGVDVSMDGRGRWIDNRFIERLMPRTLTLTRSNTPSPTARRPWLPAGISSQPPAQSRPVSA